MKISCILLVVASVMTNTGSQFKGYFGVYWYNSTDNVNERPFINIIENRKGGYGLEEFDILPSGSLVMKNVNFGHARTYTVVKLDSPTDEIIPRYVNVSVQAPPTPPYPVIEGCNSQEACLLEVRHQGNLTCSVAGIASSVDLEWRRVDENSHITFTSSHQFTTPTTYDRFNVTLTSSFYMNHTRDYTFKVECTVMVRERGPKFDLRSEVILLFSTEKVQMTSQSGIVPIKKSLAAAIVVPLIIIVVLIAIFATVGIVYKRKEGRRLYEDSDTEEGNAITKSQDYCAMRQLPVCSSNNRAITQENREEKESLLKMTARVGLVKQHLQETYMELFGTMKVLPNIRGKGEPTKMEQTIETVSTTDEGPTNDVEDVEGSNDATSLKDEDAKTTEKDNNMDVGKKAEKQLRLNKSKEENAKGWTIESPADIKVSSTSQVAFTKDRLLVEPNVQVLTSKSGSGTQGIWENVESLSKVLTDPNSESKCFIIEGEFGYDTSNICKLLAREWVMKEESPLASSFDILAILKENQIHGDNTIYSEIKRLVHPRHSITDDDIEKVVSKHDKVALIIDCCNEYTDDECRRNPEVINIVRREILTDCTVILTTLSSCVPNDSIQEFTRLRANDLLSEKDQETLISQAVFVQNTEDKDKIRSLVKESFLLRDILQIYLFFDSFLKMISRHLTNLPPFESITSLFLRIFAGFYDEDPRVAQWDNKLGNVALETLTSQHRNGKTWNKDGLIATVGEDVYNFYHQMGVLIEEQVFHWDPQLDQSSNTHLEPEITVKFAHFLFCEWYAAQYLANPPTCHDKKYMKDKLKKLLVRDCWYCIRFICGIKRELLREVIEPKVLQLMCSLEAKRSFESVFGDVKSWCSKEVSLTQKESRTQQMATVQLLEFGSKKEVAHLTLENCFNSVGGGSDFLQLRSGVRLPVLKNLKRLDIIGKNGELTKEEATGILNFALRCSKLQNLRFCQCIVPKTLEQMDISDASKLKEVKVEWTPLADPSHVYYLGRKNLTWKKQKKENMDDVLYKVLVEQIREKNG